MRGIALLFFLGVWLAEAGALECQPPALLKQADGKDDTLHSWCEVDGVRDGVFEVVSLKKGLELRANYKKGELDGRFKRFSDNNTLVADGNYADGKMSGEWVRHWPSGKLRDRGAWKDDKPVGRWQIFDDKGKLEREVTYDAEGKITAEEKPKEKENLTSADRWRLRFGVANTERDNMGDAGGLGLGADLRLFRFGRWFRSDLGVRFVPDLKSKENSTGNTGNNKDQGDKIYSGQLAFSFDLFPNVTDPVALYIRLGIHMINFDKPRPMGGLGLRYHFTNKRQNWLPNGIFAEFSGAEGEDNNQQTSGPGPGNNSNNNQDGGSMTFLAGALWAFF